MFQEGTSAVTFNSAFYLQQNPDVFTAIQNGSFQGSALDHFTQFGQFEGRDPNAFFDTEYYLANNTDVLVAIANPAIPSVTSAFQHFVMFGQEEGVVRAPSAQFEGFTEADYLAANPDVAAAVAAGVFDNGFEHFLQFGVNEVRAGSGVTVDPNPGVPGETLAFTTGVDTLVGTTNNDTFTGVISDTGGTFQAGDSVDGAAGTDRLNLTVSGAVAAEVVATTVTNVEQVFTRAVADDVVLDTSDWSGVSQLWSDRSTKDVGYGEIQSNVALGLNNTTGDLAAGFAAGALKSDSTVAVISNSSTGNVSVLSGATAAALAGITLTVTGENDIDLDAGAVKAITIGGEGSVELTGDALVSATTINASGNSGGVDVTLTGNTAAALAVTGGAGDDVFRFGTSLTKTDTVDGGEGFNTVAITTTDITSADAAAPFNAFKNVDRVEFEGATSAVNGATFTNASITNLLFNTTDTDTILNAGAARTYEFGTDNGGSAAFAMKAGQTTLNIDLLGNDEGLDADVEGITVTTAGVGSTTTPVTINLDAQGTLVQPATAVFTDDNFNETGLITAASGSTVNIDGAANLAIFGGTGGAVTAGFANNVIVDASGFGGELIISGSDFTGTPGVVGTAGGTPAGAAQVLANTGVDTITLGTGDVTDIIVFSNADASGVIETTTNTATPAVTTATGNIFHDVIVNFEAGAGGDVLFVGADLADAVPADDYTAIATATQDAINGLSGGGATLLGAANLAANDVGAAGWTAFTFQGETYALFDATAAATGGFTNEDTLVRLTGVNVADLTDANFAA